MPAILHRVQALGISPWTTARLETAEDGPTVSHSPRSPSVTPIVRPVTSASTRRAAAIGAAIGAAPCALRRRQLRHVVTETQNRIAVATSARHRPRSRCA
jgi:hypothetical protein